MDKVMLRVDYSVLASHNISSVPMTCEVLERTGKTAGPRCLQVSLRCKSREIAPIKGLFTDLVFASSHPWI